MQEFFERNLTDPSKRRRLICNWHSTAPHSKYTRLADVFEDFIWSVLYEPPDIHFMMDRIIVFGQNYPIWYEWLDRADRKLVQDTFLQNHESHFDSKRRFGKQSTYFDYSSPQPPIQIENIWRRQLVRDFVWIVLHKKARFITMELITAVQAILVRIKNRDIFLATMHCALQGRLPIFELVCWGLNQWDLHPEEERNKKLTALVL